MTAILIAILALNLPGDIRTRCFFSFPEPRGIEEGYWAGDLTCFYQRLRFSAGNWRAVVLTEKDEGEEWGDLVAGGLGYSRGTDVTACAGALRVQFAHGLVLGHSGSWGSSDPLSLSKAASWRMRLEPAESPGVSDAAPLTGVAAGYSTGAVFLAGVLSRSFIDPGETGLHRSPSEIDSRGSIKRDLGAFRVGWGPFGVSCAAVSDQEDSVSASAYRAGADLLLRSENSVLTGEFSTDFDSTADFILSASRGLPDFRHGITLSRSTGQMPETSGSFSTSHRFAAGYGVRWKPLPLLLVDCGVLVLQRELEDRVKTSLMLTQNLANRTELTQRISLSEGGGERTLSGRLTAGWSPNRDITLSLKVPVARFTSSNSPDESGIGIEARLKHRLTDLLEYGVSLAGCSTDGWNSRVYAYSLSFPGEYGSAALYDRTTLLQASLSFNIDDGTVLRLKGSWYCMEGADALGTGWEETSGSSRTNAGMQLDWKFD